MSPRLRAVVFDFDGVFAESAIDFEAMRQGIAEIAAEYFSQGPGSGSLRALEWMESLGERLAGTNPAGAAEFRQRCFEMIEAMEMEAAARAGLFPFVRPMLRDMARDGIGAAVITRNCARAVATVFPDAQEYCRCLLARDHVERVKPDPDHLLRALEVLGCPPEQCLMVGDHPLDIETGRRAGTRTAGVAGGRNSEEELRRHGADVTAPDCRILMDRLKACGWSL